MKQMFQRKFLAPVLLFLGACASQQPQRTIAGDSYLKTEELENGMRFGAEWTVSSQELLDSFPVDGNQVRVETPYSLQKVNKLKDQLEKSQARRTAKEKIKISEKNSHSHWSRRAYTVQYPDKFEFTFFSDPGAIEVNTSPSSLALISKK